MLPILLNLIYMLNISLLQDPQLQTYLCVQRTSHGDTDLEGIIIRFYKKKNNNANKTKASCSAQLLLSPMLLHL